MKLPISILGEIPGKGLFIAGDDEGNLFTVTQEFVAYAKIEFKKPVFTTQNEFILGRATIARNLTVELWKWVMPLDKMAYCIYCAFYNHTWIVRPKVYEYDLSNSVYS